MAVACRCMPLHAACRVRGWDLYGVVWLLYSNSAESGRVGKDDLPWSQFDSTYLGHTILGVPDLVNVSACMQLSLRKRVGTDMALQQFTLYCCLFRLSDRGASRRVESTVSRRITTSGA
jgi:hypothetical protein